jgi:hypothetical protein
MSTNSSAALRAAVHDALISNVGLASVLGGQKSMTSRRARPLFPMSLWARPVLPIFRLEAKPPRSIS